MKVQSAAVINLISVRIILNIKFKCINGRVCSVRESLFCNRPKIVSLCTFNTLLTLALATVLFEIDFLYHTMDTSMF